MSDLFKDFLDGSDEETQERFKIQSRLGGKGGNMSGFADWMYDPECSAELPGYLAWLSSLDTATRRRELVYTASLNKKASAVCYVKLEDASRLAIVLARTTPSKEDEVNEALQEMSRGMRAATQWLNDRRRMR